MNNHRGCTPQTEGLLKQSNHSCLLTMAQRSLTRIPGKTVYILGTGFSAPLRMPVINHFIPDGLRILSEHALALEDKASRQSINDLIDRFMCVLCRYQPTLRLAQADDTEPTIQDVFSMVDLMEYSQKQTGELPSQPSRNVLEQFLYSVCHLKLPPNPPVEGSSKWKAEWFDWLVDHIHLSGGNRFAKKSNLVFGSDCGRYELVSAYVAFLSQLVNSQEERLERFHVKEAEQRWLYTDAIVSLNYDLVLEASASSISPSGGDTLLRLSYGKEVAEPSKDIPWLNASDPLSSFDIPLFKLHGSFNWQPAADGKIKVLPIPALGDIPPTLPSDLFVWPTWLRAKFDGVLDKLKNQALEHLKLASKIVIIGYSLPDTDIHIRYLLAQALSTPQLPKVEICEYKKPKEAVIQAWEKMLGSLGKRTNPTVHPDGFVEYVKIQKTTANLL
jgi:hypothetical protein